jgi:hypothetical protein
MQETSMKQAVAFLLGLVSSNLHSTHTLPINKAINIFDMDTNCYSQSGKTQ